MCIGGCLEFILEWLQFSQLRIWMSWIKEYGKGADTLNLVNGLWMWPKEWQEEPVRQRRPSDASLYIFSNQLFVFWHMLWTLLLKEMHTSEKILRTYVFQFANGKTISLLKETDGVAWLAHHALLINGFVRNRMDLMKRALGGLLHRLSLLLPGRMWFTPQLHCWV